MYGKTYNMIVIISWSDKMKARWLDSFFALSIICNKHIRDIAFDFTCVTGHRHVMNHNSRDNPESVEEINQNFCLLN